MDKLEEAVYAGRGGDEWVVELLQGQAGGVDLRTGGHEGRNGDVLKGTKIANALEVSDFVLWKVGDAVDTTDKDGPPQIDGHRASHRRLRQGRLTHQRRDYSGRGLCSARSNEFADSTQ